MNINYIGNQRIRKMTNNFKEKCREKIQMLTYCPYKRLNKNTNPFKNKLNNKIHLMIWPKAYFKITINKALKKIKLTKFI